MKKLPAILLLAALAGGGAWYYQRTPSTAQSTSAAAPAEKLFARAEKRDIDFRVEVSGDVTPAFQLDVKPEVGGKLKSLNVEPGDTVKAGDLVVEIDDRDLQTEKESAVTEIEGAQLQVDRIRKNLDRAKELFSSKLISREVFDNLTSEFAIAENSLVRSERRLQLVEDRLRKTRVLAPTDGTVLTVPVIEGQVVIAAASVNSGTTLMTIANLSKLLVETHINQVDVAKLEMNQKVKLRAESFRDVEMEATISFIAPVATVKNNVKGFQVQALIDQPSDRLRPGMTVSMTVPIARADAAVSVPISAVFKGDGNARVVYVKNGETTEKREVKVGVTNIDYAQILNGLEPGEQILLVEPDRFGEKKS
jgi:RND family efflux transporter MFP subunit